jgi:hypothetical protein
MAGSSKCRKAADAAQKTKALLEKCAIDAVRVLVSLMQDEGQKSELRMKAAESILDRVCGKAGNAGATSGVQIPDTVRFEGDLEEWSR